MEPTATPPVQLPPPGGRVGRIGLALTLGLLGLFQVAVGIQADRTATVVTGSVILVVAVSLGRRNDRGVTFTADGVDIPGWPRGAQVPWAKVERVVVHRLPGGIVRLQLARSDRSQKAPPRNLTTLLPPAARRWLPDVRALAEAREVPVTGRDGHPLPPTGT